MAEERREENINRLQKDRKRRQEEINELRKESLRLLNEELSQLSNAADATQRRALLDQKINLLSQISTKEYESQRNYSNDIAANLTKIYATGRGIYRTLMDSDKVIKSTALTLGLTSARSEHLRNVFEDTAGYAARLGGSIEDLGHITTMFANETGRARIMSEETYKNVLQMARATGLGVEGGAKLATQYDRMGVGAIEASQYTLGILETSERMGVNATKVLSNISDNFSRLRTFTFRQGVAGFAEMASYAEKMRIDMGQALDSAEAARRLDKAIDMATQLQVMGGEFAKTDPFELLFLSRNDPDQYTKKINEMTKGVVSFRKTADGSFEKFLSPADRDRLVRAADALGLQSDELIIQAQKMAEIDQIRRQTVGMGLTDEQQELIEGIGTFDSEVGKFQVKFGGVVRNLEDLNKEQLKTFANQAETLEERAKTAQTFDEVFRASVNELKTILLPMLRGFNDMIERIRPTVIDITDWLKEVTGKDLISSLAYFGVGAVVLKGAATTIASAIANAGGILGGGRKGTPTVTRGGGGKGVMGTGAGIGIAGAGIGAGVGAAAGGISMLADSMKELDIEQLKTLQNILIGMGTSGFVAAGAVIALGKAGLISSKGLFALGAASLMIGSGIGIAVASVGYLTSSIGKMMEKSEGVDNTLFSIANGVTAIGTSALANVAGLTTFSILLGRIARKGDDLEKVGNAFKEINTMLSGNIDDFKEFKKVADSISNIQIGDKGIISELAALLKKPLQVEFTNKEIAIVTDVTLNIDGEKLTEKLNMKKIANLQQKTRQGIRSER